ncbi:tyrosine-type recombinase/integrase [Pseudonocardia humida]|uniref:Tyrosine-type recombinase/integrase n=1 Tax=Pseudonocardia humida TaxID=2800819 RepID=A0ABT1A7K0_9PSEU|nr:tyrosine-type recombinase/integrase [Pseudonocardia humida]MCO1658911.1 tyrosine-type recombinase/integrase [Pseudonocardia humida]
MPPSGSTRRQRQRGEIETLPSGSLRVRVYAGVDPISGKRHHLTEVIPAGKDAAKLAEKARTRMQAEVDERRNPRTRATVAQLMERYLDVLQIEDTTRAGYERLVRLHIGPLLGRLAVGRIDGETLDSFYRELRRCRTHCGGRPVDEHHTDGEHTCDKRCGPHRCRPLSTSSVRQTHNLLNGAFTRAVRWRWVGSNPVRQAEPPALPKADPQPPTPAQAARIVTTALTDPDWGMLVWLAMTTGARRGELCALRWRDVDFAQCVVRIGSSLGQLGSRVWEKDTKTHQRRRIVLDAQTLALLRSYLHRRAELATALGTELAADGFVFSSSLDGSTPVRPDTVTQRYRRMCARLGWDMHIHQLRHFSATELIAAGVDVRTVAGRLGHSGGGTTTLRVYAAWVAEADQRAAETLAARLPDILQTTEPAAALPAGSGSSSHDPPPHELIATDLRGAIRCGALTSGDQLPTCKELGTRYGVAISTAQRAVATLRDEGRVRVARGRRATVA